MGKRRQKRSKGSVVYNVYRVVSPAHETQIVFAGGIWGAVGVLLQWRAAMGIGEVPFTIDPNWAATLCRIGRQHIDEARAACRGPCLGVRYRADDGWGLAEPPYDPDEGLWAPG